MQICQMRKSLTAVSLPEIGERSEHYVVDLCIYNICDAGYMLGWNRATGRRSELIFVIDGSFF